MTKKHIAMAMAAMLVCGGAMAQKKKQAQPEYNGGITTEMMKQMKQGFGGNASDKALRNILVNNAPNKLAMNYENATKFDSHFSNRVVSKAVTDQKSSGRCWMFTGMNVLRAKMIKEQHLPTAIEFYCPEKVKRRTHSQVATFESIKSALNPEVKPVDIFKTLADHASEDIYLRTDHHWAPLGAYYAARRFARMAKVPFQNLDCYDTITMSGYVGTMAMYSRDPRVKQSPEDFVYYIPRNAEYTTYYTNFKLDKKRRNVVSEGEEHEGNFFIQSLVDPQKPANSYCVFGGGDYKLIKVRTNVNNGRRLLILKDSFGNALPGYLFYSFEEIHVVDCRYFKKNVLRYIRDNGITDVVFANNIGHAYSTAVCRYYERFLTQ